MENLPIIKNYEDFKKYNEDLMSKKEELSLESVEIVQKIPYRTVIAMHIGNMYKEEDMLLFLYNFVKEKKYYIKTGLKYFKGFDFSRLYAICHQEEFERELKAYMNNLTLVDDFSFRLWNYDIKFDGTNYILSTPKKRISYYQNTEIIPSFVTEIDTHAFLCSYVENIIFQKPSKLKIVGAGAFQLCQNLKKIELPSGVEEIRSTAFESDILLQEVKFPETVNKVSPFIFCGCHSLKRLVMPKEVLRLLRESFINN